MTITTATTMTLITIATNSTTMGECHHAKHTLDTFFSLFCPPPTLSRVLSNTFLPWGPSYGGVYVAMGRDVGMGASRPQGTTCEHFCSARHFALELLRLSYFMC